MVAIRRTRASNVFYSKEYNEDCIAAAMFDNAPTSMPPTTDILYKRIGQVERAIGGDSGIIGMSGSVVRLDLAKILCSMGIDSSSHLLDVGSGLGRPMLHALHAGAARASGIEFDIMKHRKCQTVISRILPVEDQIRTCCHHGDVLCLDSLATLDPTITHIFSFWEGINIDAREAVGRLVTKSRQAGSGISTVAFVQAHVEHLESYMDELFFPRDLKLVDTFPVTMIGSASRFKAYIFKFPPRAVPSRKRKREPLAYSRKSRPRSLPCKESAITSCDVVLDTNIQQQSIPAISVLFPHETILGDYVVARRGTRAYGPACTASREVVLSSVAGPKTKDVTYQPFQGDVILADFIVEHRHTRASKLGGVSSEQVIPSKKGLHKSQIPDRTKKKVEKVVTPTATIDRVPISPSMIVANTDSDLLAADTEEVCKELTTHKELVETLPMHRVLGSTDDMCTYAEIFPSAPSTPKDLHASEDSFCEEIRDPAAQSAPLSTSVSTSLTEISYGEDLFPEHENRAETSTFMHLTFMEESPEPEVRPVVMPRTVSPVNMRRVKARRKKM